MYDYAGSLDIASEYFSSGGESPPETTGIGMEGEEGSLKSEKQTRNKPENNGKLSELFSSNSKLHRAPSLSDGFGSNVSLNNHQVAEVNFL